MIQLIGIRHDVKVEIREKLSIIPKHCKGALVKLKMICEEAVVVSTCNRTEIYINTEQEGEELIHDLFRCLGWDKQYIQYTFYAKGQQVVKHLMEVVCGFDSVLIGEDQILGQIKRAYELSLTLQVVEKDLLRLFQIVITCGKAFRHKSELYKIPVSLASLVVKECRRRKSKRFMILGFGEIGQLVAKYILKEDFEVLYIVVRDRDEINMSHPKTKVFSFNDRNRLYSDVDCIISCTSAPHVVITGQNLPQKEFLIFDLAVPRDVEPNLAAIDGIEVYDTDQIGLIQDENRYKRQEMMLKNKCVIEHYSREFATWQKLKELSPYIQKIKTSGEIVYQKMSRTFKNKRKGQDDEMLAERLLKSTSNVFVKRAIEVLKEEHLKGRGEECLIILEKIFQVQT